ncbi:MAG: NAD(+)/NADH kinase [Fimbriimonadaceae bacterium]|nr:NAD(+)/NADH kinase [Fimbriimonadaceae bacterium]
MRIHLVANIHRADALRAAREIGQWTEAHSHTVGYEAETARSMGMTAVPADEFADADLVIAFGGDGTLIRAAHLCSLRGTPILGVYFGRFGFVTQCTPEDMRKHLERFLRGEALVESRMMLETRLMRAGSAVAVLHALNEIAVQRAVTARMMTFRVTVDGQRITSYPADGVLVSTPTGSTAYNLSAGGPILDPNVEAIVLTAIAPHTLSHRSLVLRPGSELRLRVTSEGESVLSADALTRLHLLSGDEVHVTKSERVTNLVSTSGHDFLGKLGHRLFWSKGMVGESL